MSAVTARRLLPLPALAGGFGVRTPYVRVVPNSKKYVVSSSFGVTPPVSVAVFWPTLAAGPVVTSGRAGAAVAPAGTSRPAAISTVAMPVPPWILRRFMFPFRSINRSPPARNTGDPEKARCRSSMHGDEHDPRQRRGHAGRLLAAHPLAAAERKPDGHEREQ